MSVWKQGGIKFYERVKIKYKISLSFFPLNIDVEPGLCLFESRTFFISFAKSQGRILISTFNADASGIIKAK